MENLLIKILLEKKKNLLEVGCGNGRDSFYLSKKVKIISIDKSAETIKQNLIILRKIKKKNFYFKKLDAIRLATIKLVKFNYIYARFFLHTINLSSEKKGLAKFKNDNPSVCRIILEKK